MILKQGHKYRAMPHDGKLIDRIYRGGRCYYIASPYSPEATQALKAAFPQYWTAIRDYGVAHPQLVPFINEDPMLIVSLVEVGKTRWLVSDGMAFVEPNYVPNINSKFYFDFMFLELVGTYQGAYGNYMSETTEQYRIITDNTSTTKFSAQFATTTWNPNIDLGNIVGKRCTGTQEYQKCVINGVSYTTPSQSGSDNPTGLHLFRGSGGTASTSMGNKRSMVKMTMFDIEEDRVLVRKLLPFIRNGENGMLDILSGTFYPNANTEGAFTIQITDKA